MLYFAYHRTSTEEQHLDRGLNEINKYIKDNGIEVVNIYTDQCTGKNFNRPNYKKMLEDTVYKVYKFNWGCKDRRSAG